MQKMQSISKTSKKKIYDILNKNRIWMNHLKSKEIEIYKENVLEKIKIIRRYQKDYNSDRKHKLPNIYSMVYEKKKNNSGMQEQYYLLSRDGKIDNVIFVNFKMMCSKIFRKEEIQKYFNNDKDICKYKYQSLKRIA